MAEDALTELETMVNTAFAEDPPIKHPEEAMHLYFSLSEAIFQLGAEDVAAALRETFPWYLGGFEVDPDHWPDGTDPAKMVDSLADFSKEAGKLLADWLTEHGLGEVRLTCYMACHKAFATVVFGKPRG